MKPVSTDYRSTTTSYRALIIGALLIPINLYWLTLAETIYQPVFSTLFTLFYNVTFTLFLLVVLNAFLNKYIHSIALQPSELLIIYVMISIATGIFGHDLLLVMVQHLTSFWFVTPENEWMVLFGRHVPEWATVYDSVALQGYHKGETTLYIAEHLKPWIIPALGWGGFLIVLLFVIVCINVIIRKQWTENERLAYPVIQLPMELTKGGTGLLYNRLLWLGFGLAGTFDFINGLHGLWPVVPNFAPIYNLGQFFTAKCRWLVAFGSLSLCRWDGLFLATEPGVLSMVFSSYLEGRLGLPECDGNLGDPWPVPKLSNGGRVDSFGDFTVVVCSIAPQASRHRSHPWENA